MSEKIIPWKVQPSLDQLNARAKNTLLEHLGIEFTGCTPTELSARMPVDARTHQPLGLLHGGASAALAESIMSTAGNMVVDTDREYCVGLEINANHLRSTRTGEVQARCWPLHLGRTTQVWQCEISQGDKNICVSRMTLAVLAR